MARRSTHTTFLLTGTAAVAAVLAAAAVLPSATLAATSATGSQSVTADVASTLEATFPSAYAWGNLSPGTPTSADQTVNVKSNASWGLKASTDAVDGIMREWTGAAYVASTPKVLAHPLTWRPHTVGGVNPGASFAAFTSTPALATGAQGVTGDSGVDVALEYRQTVSYADASAGSNDYRILVSFDVAQGY
ncbi:hypothetical protein DSM112329_03804 [Paraconexibacter sp. AEG42_29]|uniref:Uncharacterized protein n=1 Tax=Paraconexibacter sp. AEG42_29 TaxID=2997339 RepID=A0AAU7AYU5_9ACTN